MFVVLLLMSLAGWVGRAVRSARDAVRRRRRDGRVRPAPAPGSAGGFTAEEAECLLVAGLLADLVEREEYRSGMALLARADEDRHPLSVPSPPEDLPRREGN